MRLQRYRSLKRLPAAIAVVLAACFAAILTACHQPAPPAQDTPPPKQTPLPSINSLTDALQHSAEKNLPAPSLANEQIILSASDGSAQPSDILAAASAAGGAGIPGADDKGEVSILATIPENNAAAFKAALRHEKAPMSTPSTSTTLIEVIIQRSAAASPSP